MPPRFALAILVALTAILGAGCARNAVETSTGLPYRPDDLGMHIAPGRGAAAPSVQTSPGSAARVSAASPRRANVPYDRLTPTDWRIAAGSWIGTPYRTGGTTREGADCSGFAMSLHSEVTGIRLPRTTGQQWEQGREVPVNAVRPGDLLFFQTLRGQDAVSHVGVVVGQGEFAHAGTSSGVTFAEYDQGYWQRRLVGARRFVP